MTASLGRMVGFRNIAVHEYQSLDVAIVAAVIRHELDGLLRFAGLLLSRQLPESN
ncbi:HepT-like ribonuclease domain-containing protein [uncultured Pseudacidovorax sp.]|uniref:HepT-like ribonuclease domain-containing protein n=1 Tax=uncultured Pseudacidovorax sp. TaxID=679313 RepID=UPI0025E2705F|nr:HepT-like ribonuclease domain-containing protein [uncultured Pseudacidovorax sp.]